MHPALKLVGWTIAPLVLSLPISMVMGGLNREVIAQMTSDRKAEAEQLLMKGAQLLQSGDAENALQYLQRALALYRKIPDRQLEAYALGNIGSVYAIRKDYKKAVEFFEQSLSIARQFNDQEVKKGALQGLGNAYRELEDYPKAIDYFKQSLALWRELKDREAEAKVLNSLGNTYYFAKDYEKAITIHQQALELSRSLKNRAAEGDAFGNLGVIHAARQDYRKAVDYFQQNLVIVQELKDREGESQTLRNLGDALFNVKDYAKAIEYRLKSIDLARTRKDRVEEAIALRNLGKVYFELRKYPKAIEYYQQSLKIANNLKNQNLSGQALQSLGETYFSMKDYPKAIQSYEKSLTLAKELGNMQKQAELLMSLGYTSLEADLLSQSLEYHQQGLKVAREMKDRNLEGWFLLEIGRSYKQLKNYEKAENFYEESLAVGKNLGYQDLVSTALNNLGDIYLLIQDYSQAIDYLQQSLLAAQKLADPVRKAQIELRTFNALIDINVFIGNYSEALEYARNTLSISRKEKDKSREMKALKQLGFIHLQLGDYKEAISSSRLSLGLSKELEDERMEAGILSDIGNVYFKLGQPKQAIEYFLQSLALARKVQDQGGQANALIGLGNIYSLLLFDFPQAIKAYRGSLKLVREKNDSELELATLINLGSSLFLNENFLESEKTLHDAIKIWESLRTRLGRRDIEKVLFREQVNLVYNYLQRALIAQGKVKVGLEFAEQSRARALSELLAARISSGTAMPTSNETVTVQQLQQIAKEQNATLVQYSVIYEPAKALVSDFLPDVPLSAIDTQSQTELFIWVIKPTGELTFRKVELAPFISKQEIISSFAPLTALVTTTREFIGVRSGRSDINVALSPEALQEMQKQEKYRLQKLHQILIKPIVDLLPSNPSDQIIFIPHDSLFLAPFPALQDTDGKYLIERHTILTAPSIQVLQQTRQLKANRSATTGKSEALVLGNPVMPKVALSPGKPPQPLTPLLGAEREAVAIAPLLNTQAILGNQATKAAIVQKMPQANIIHLATHGILDNERGLGSAIALAPDPALTEEKLERTNGLLTAEEILDMKLNADLVVLSACDTGRGRITGDGVIGLSRSFISAGVPSVIVSLWAVPDAPTAELMTEFYKNWKERNLNKAQALRQAMLTTMKTHPNPRDWAAFTLIGEAE